MDQTFSIRDLQHMLNHLSYQYPALPRLAEHGTFDELTLEAVMIFQRDFAPPVTGIVDENTWYAIVSAYQYGQLNYGFPPSLRVFPNGTFATEQGEISAQMRVAQVIFVSLPPTIVNFKRGTPDGINAGANRENLVALQRLAALPETGTLNRATWDFLARLYHIFVTRNGFSANR